MWGKVKPVSDLETKKAMVAMWAKRGAAIDARRATELAEYEYADNYEVIDGLLNLAFQHRRPRSSSGLVEMRRLFEKAWA